MIILLVVLCFFFQQAESSPTEETHQPPRRPRTAEDAIPKPPYLRMDPLRFSVIKKDKSVANIFLLLELETINIDETEEIRSLLPYIHSAFLKDLYPALSVLWISEKDPSTESIRHRLLKVVKTLVCADKIKNVYIKTFYIQRLS